MNARERRGAEVHPFVEAGVLDELDRWAERLNAEYSTRDFTRTYIARIVLTSWAERQQRARAEREAAS
jgi:hypothetical protein